MSENIDNTTDKEDIKNNQQSQDITGYKEIKNNPYKNSTDSEELRHYKAESEYKDKKKNEIVTWLLWLFVFPIGAHRYYLGHITYAVFMTITLGGLGIWALIDAFLFLGHLEK